MSQTLAPTAARDGRVAELDGLRGMGVVFVVGVHCFRIVPVSPLTDFLYQLSGAAMFAMDVFFALSGYLITGILIRARSRAHYFRNFYIRRVLRILPAYYLVLALIFLVVPWLLPEEAGLPRYAGWFFLHLQNILMGFFHPHTWEGTTHLWSLAVEEHYYLLWPLIVYFTPLSALRRLCLWLAALAVAAKVVLYLAHAGWHLIYMFTLTRMDGIALGSFIATLAPATAARWWRPAFATGIVATLVLIAACAAFHGWLHPLRTVIVTTCSPIMGAVLVLGIHGASLPGPLRQFFRGRWIIWLGTYSYGIYLLHYPIVNVLRERLAPWLGAQVVDSANLVSMMIGVIALASSLALAWLMFTWWEKPMLDLRHRFTPEMPATVPRAPADA